MGVSVRISEEAKKFLSDLLAASINGNCYEFAVMMHRNLGWPLVGLIENFQIIHVGVKSPDGKYWDGRGGLSQTDFIKPFKKDCLEFEYIEESDLISHKISDRVVGIFLEKAQLLWPELPWKKPTDLEIIEFFAKDLEELSRKYRLWIGSPTSSGPSVIFKGIGDETGYELTLSEDGNAFFINRKL